MFIADWYNAFLSRQIRYFNRQRRTVRHQRVSVREIRASARIAFDPPVDSRPCARTARRRAKIICLNRSQPDTGRADSALPNEKSSARSYRLRAVE